jgi:dCTP deaminase
MVISGETLKKKIKNKEIIIKGVTDKQIQPASIDLRLAEDFLVIDEHNHHQITLDTEIKYRKIKGKNVIIPPKSFVLAKTKEHIEIPLDCTAFVEGRSSIGRLGLFIQNAGYIDPGFKGTITLELFNACNVPIKLESNRRICQLVVLKLDKKIAVGYQGKYLGQQDVTGSRINKDIECKVEEEE